MLQLKQKRENLVVFIHAALSNDNVQRPVNLQEITALSILHFLSEIVTLFKIQVFQQLYIYFNNVMQWSGQMNSVVSITHYFTPFLDTPFLLTYSFYHGT